MSAKTENDGASSDEKNDEKKMEDHTYYDIDGFVTKQLAPYLEGEPEKTPVVLFVNSLCEEGEPFERTGLVPTRALERARQDVNSSFAWGLCHAIALSYKREIMMSRSYGGGDLLKCQMCGNNNKPVTDLLMTPLSFDLVQDPPRIFDIFPTPVCDDPDCIIAGRNRYLGIDETMNEVVKDFCAEKGLPDEPKAVHHIHICSYCGDRVRPNKKRCTRCQTTYYCDRACQRRHWLAGHREKCQPPPPPAAKDSDCSAEK